MDRRSNNIAIFQDSMDMIKASQKLQQAIGTEQILTVTAGQLVKLLLSLIHI